MNLSYLYPMLRFDTLSISVSVACLFFSLLIGLYSFKFLKGKVNLFSYYINFILTALVCCLAVLANNLILLLVCWGFLGLTLYMLIYTYRTDKSSVTAKKTLIIVGASDSIMILGVSLVFYLAGTFQMDRIQIPLGSLEGILPTFAYISLAIACFTKAGAMPFHTWIVDCASDAPVSVNAYLPAALDKLLGIYFLFRISTSLFVMSEGMNTFLMALGSFTIIAAVMMALVQHDLKRLLGYHAVSQVGYMILGIGTGSAVGIAGGLFHMLNNTIYKSSLFLCAGNVEEKTGISDLDRLGGLRRFMPFTFVACLIASLSISGVPPFNGFFSKWMIYQGIIGLGSAGYKWWVIWLAAAMFGSSLTLASFMKILHTVFLGTMSKELKKLKLSEASWILVLPALILAFLCLLFGVFAKELPLRLFLTPVVGDISIIGNWSPLQATILILVAMLAGLIIFYLWNFRALIRQDQEAFIGGEVIPSQSHLSGVDFYNSIKELPLINGIYKKAEQKWFDIYELLRRFTFSASGVLQHLHNGILPTYTVWCLLGMIALFLAFVR
ncbi:MAG: proton-conducting transporter membrane subunit [Candidatus Omnitrophota bacterium]